MRRRAAITGVAVVAMAAIPAQVAQAATITVRCSVPALVAAINTANSTPGAHILNLAGGCTYTLVAPDNAANGLPVINSDITINGSGNGNGPGATITRDPSAPGFRILAVASTGKLTLNSVTTSGGAATDCPGFDGICGGGIYDLGTLTVNHSG
jgi:hypothetical protein